MAVGTDTINIYRGEDVVLEFAMDPSEDITGWAIEFTVEGNGTEKIIEATGTITDGPGGQFSVTLAAADTDQRPGTYQYDVWRTDSGSNTVIAVGSFQITDVARLPA